MCVVCCKKFFLSKKKVGEILLTPGEELNFSVVVVAGTSSTSS